MTELPVCPYCGHKEKDAWEINFGHGLDGDATVTCGSCGADYFCERIVSVSYKTETLPGYKRKTGAVLKKADGETE